MRQRRSVAKDREATLFCFAMQSRHMPAAENSVAAGCGLPDEAPADFAHSAEERGGGGGFRAGTIINRRWPHLDKMKEHRRARTSRPSMRVTCLSL